MKTLNLAVLFLSLSFASCSLMPNKGCCKKDHCKMESKKDCTKESCSMKKGEKKKCSGKDKKES